MIKDITSWRITNLHRENCNVEDVSSNARSPRPVSMSRLSFLNNNMALDPEYNKN